MKKIAIGTFQKICTLLLAFCFFQTATAQSWQETESGAAQDMSIGPSEEVWITTKRNEIMRWRNDHFEKVSGSAKRISVGADGDVWIVTPAGGIAHFDPENDAWVKVSGSATDIGACVSGSVWAIGSKPADGGYQILRWNEGEWEVIPGGALRVDVDDQGHPWFVNDAHIVFTLDEEYHVVNKGDNLQDISVDAHGHIWGTTTNNEIMKFENDHWEPHPGNAICATSSWEGYPWAINEQGKVMWYDASGGDATAETEPEAPVEDEVAKETTVEESSKEAVAPTKPSKPAPKEDKPTVAVEKEGRVDFQNVGDRPVEVYRSSSSKIGELVESIRPKSKITIPVNIGDQFEVKVLGEEFGSHPKIYITDFEETQIIYGNSPVSKMPGYIAERFVMLDYQSNQFGINISKFNPRNLVSSINSKNQIFEPLNIAEGIDYRVLGDGKIMKHGFSYASTNLREGSKEVTMSYGYSSFSKNWSLSVGGSGTIPVKKAGVDVTPSLDFTYSEKEMTDRSSENSYAYSREQVSIFTVSVDPKKAQLDPEFKIAVLRVKDLNSAKSFVAQFGTHYAKTIYYGGDRSVYAVFNKEQYNKAKSFGIDIKGSVGVSKSKAKQKGDDASSSKDDNDDKKQKSLGEGKLAFSYEQGSKEESVFEKAVTKYRMIGGNGGFDVWDVSESNAAPVSAELDYIYTLITPQIFKDGTDAVQLSKAQYLIEAATDLVLDAMPLLKNPLPPPNSYSVTIDKLEVIEEIDDANKNTKGNISLEMVYQDKNGQTIASSSSGNFWSIPDFSLDFKFTKGNIIYPNATYKMVDFPDSSTGSFKKLLFNVKGSIQEKDDILWDNNDEMNGETGRINIADLRLSPGQSSQSKSFDLVFNENARSNRIRVTYKIRREPSEFDDKLF